MFLRIILSIITYEIPVTILLAYIPLPQHIRQRSVNKTYHCVTFMYSSKLPASLLRIENTPNETRIMFERYYSFFHQCRLSCRYVMFQKQHFEKTEMWGHKHPFGRVRPPLISFALATALC